jgi:hypothetical protein
MPFSKHDVEPEHMEAMRAALKKVCVVKVHVSFFALVREIEEKLPVTEANGLPRSCAAGRV